MTSLNLARLSVLLVSATALAIVAAAPAASAHPDAGWVEVHDGTRDPPDTNMAVVPCAGFFVEGFMIHGDAGTLEFFRIETNGSHTPVQPTGAAATWASDNASHGDHHFISGPFQLPAGNYVVAVHRDSGHPGPGEGVFPIVVHFKVSCPPPCPTNLTAQAMEDGSVKLSWGASPNATAYEIHRATGGNMTHIATVTAPTTLFSDVTSVPGTTYTYRVTATNGFETSSDCPAVQVTAVPVFPSIVAGALALLGAVGVFLVLRRR